jgi:hypothetical protein
MCNGSFADKVSQCGLHPLTAQLLDDMTFTFDGIRSFMDGNQQGLERARVLAAATHIHNRIYLLPSASEAGHSTSNNFMYETCRMASLIYLEVITNFVPFHLAGRDDVLQPLFAAIGKVAIQRWKPLSGIWLFVLLCINPPNDKAFGGPSFRAFMKRSAFHVSAWDWQSYVNIMETYLNVQRWSRIRGVRRSLSAVESENIEGAEMP